MAAYYNEFDPGAAAWLRELIAEGHIAPGDVDTRSIADVQPDDLKGYTQAHFFAGIGGWSLALRLGGWPDDRPVWTGSCPCQPFSKAGRRKICPSCTSDDCAPTGLTGWFLCRNCGHTWFADARHLWPEFRRLIAKRRPPVVFGEQVASKAGRDWLASVRAELEAMGHAVGAADLCSAGVGAPNIRQRLWWVADAGCDECGSGRAGGANEDWPFQFAGCRHAGVLLGDANLARLEGRWLDDGQRADKRPAWAASLAGGGLAHAHGGQPWQAGPVQPGGQHGQQPQDRGAGFWSSLDWLPCRDGKARPVEPGTFPLAHGVPGRVGLLRGYGNAINPWVAAEFIGAFLDVEARVSLDLPEPANQSQRFDRTA